jgi:hypothetical protein
MNCQLEHMRSFTVLLPLLSAVAVSACGAGQVTGGFESGSTESGSTEMTTETGSGSETDGETDSGSETDTGGPDLGPCFSELETGHYPIWEHRFAWGQVALIQRQYRGLIVGDGDEWQVLETALAASWASSADALFFERGGEIWLWDGQVETPVSPGKQVVASITESGEVWVGAHDCNTNNCPGAVMRWTGDAFEAIEPPPLARKLRGIVARDDDTRWVVDHDCNVASQVADAAWVAEGPVPNLGPTDNAFGFYAHGSDGLWLGSRNDLVRLSHRDPQGVWTWVDYEPQYSVYSISLAAVGDYFYLFDRIDHSLHRWDGVGQLEYVASLPGVTVIFGTPDRLLGVDLSHGQAVVEIDPSPTPNTEILWEAHGVTPSMTRSAATLDAVYQLDRRSLRRWSDGWTYLADSDLSADPNSGFHGLWAESADVAWVSEIDDAGSPRTRLHRWTGDALESVAHEIAADVAIHALWGSGGDRLFGWGLDPQDAPSVWAYDGRSWTQLPDPSPGYRPSRMTGSDDELFVVDELGKVFAWDGQAWSELPDAPAADLASHDLEWGAGKLFYRIYSADAFSFSYSNRVLVLDGDAWVLLENAWPGGPPNDLQSLSSDRAGGLWALDHNFDAEQQLWYFDGAAWTSVPREEPIDVIGQGDITGAPEGMIVHSERYTQQFRWECG